MNPCAGDAEPADARVGRRSGPALHHKGTYELTAEHVRERQAVATARFVEDLVRDRPDLPVVLLADLRRPDHEPGHWRDG